MCLPCLTGAGPEACLRSATPACGVGPALGLSLRPVPDRAGWVAGWAWLVGCLLGLLGLWPVSDTSGQQEVMLPMEL